MRPLDPERSVWRNGEPEGRCLDLDAHLERLLSNAGGLLERPIDRAVVRQTLQRAAAEKPHEPGWVKLIVTAAGEWFVFGGAVDPDEEGRPIRAVTLPWRRGTAAPRPP